MSDWEELYAVQVGAKKIAGKTLLYVYETTKFAQREQTIRNFQALCHVKLLPNNIILWHASRGRPKLRKLEEKYAAQIEAGEVEKKIQRSPTVGTYCFHNMDSKSKKICIQRYLDDEAENFGYE